jgi:formate hydrogenlyase regulatory protein HycA
MAFVTGAYPSDLETNTQLFPGLGSTGPEDQHWYGVVHTFDPAGNHLRTEARFGGTTADGKTVAADRAFGLANESLAALGELEFVSIRVRPFRVVIDGRVFGLVHKRDEESEWATLWPNDVMFHPPWDGTFST